MRTLHVVLLALVALAAAGLLYVTTRTNETGTERAATDPVGDNAADDASSSERVPRPLPSRPDQPASGEASQLNRETIAADGTRIRDRRTASVDSDVSAERVVRSVAKRPKADSKLMARMGLELRGAAMKCRTAHADEVRDGAKVQPRPTYRIADGQLTIVSVEISLEGIDNNGSYRSCMEAAALNIELPAPGHVEIASDTMAVPIKL